MTYEQVEDEHHKMVHRLQKSPQKILDEMTASKMGLLNAASKLCSEAGEIMDAVGKWCFYNKPLDIANIIEECGDIEFYLVLIREAILVHRKQTLKANIDKLTRRYGQEYSDQKAIERADKKV